MLVTEIALDKMLEKIIVYIIKELSVIQLKVVLDMLIMLIRRPEEKGMDMHEQH
jgi:hypothetical protein